jgi:Asp-tRNA(Asn)/Glu-tRNA(Gln) amidotransferase A subunit family amidase
MIFPTQMGSPLWKDFTAGNDARVVFYLKEEGAVIPGKTDTAEFAVHAIGNCLNPHDVTRTPGTSSSGSAVAVALRNGSGCNRYSDLRVQ